MNNPLFLRIAFILTILFTAFISLDYFGVPVWREGSSWIVSIISNLVFLGWFYLLWKAGRLRFSKLRPLFFLFLSLLLIGMLISIQHWQGRGIAFTISLVGMAVVYTLHFLQKPEKTIYEILKLAWFLSFALIKTLCALHIVDMAFQDIHIPLLLVVLFYFVKQKSKTLHAYSV